MPRALLSASLMLGVVACSDEEAPKGDGYPEAITALAQITENAERFSDELGSLGDPLIVTLPLQTEPTSVHGYESIGRDYIMRASTALGVITSEFSEIPISINVQQSSIVLEGKISMTGRDNSTSLMVSQSLETLPRLTDLRMP